MLTEELLDEAHLRYSSDENKGWSRKPYGKKFVYFDTNGKKISEQSAIERADSLAIPPAWKNVWICPHKNGHIQATGIDDKGRKQYIYHPLWIEVSQERKFEHMTVFVQVLPKVRSHVRRTLDARGLTREKVLATVIWLLENTLIRVGNEEYEEENKSYGLTTLKNRHADVSAETIRFSFKGKSGIYHDVQIKSRKVAKVIKQCQDLPGQTLFEYKEVDGSMQNISSHDVNEYLKELTGEEITAKDFRTWAGTSLAAKMLDRLGMVETETEVKKAMQTVVKKVAQHLRNLPSTSRKYYIHPAVFEAYSKGVVLSNLRNYKKAKRVKRVKSLSESENEILRLLASF